MINNLKENEMLDDGFEGYRSYRTFGGIMFKLVIIWDFGRRGKVIGVFIVWLIGCLYY
jgi:hypothetical protein